LIALASSYSTKPYFPAGWSSRLYATWKSRRERQQHRTVLYSRIL